MAADDKTVEHRSLATIPGVVAYDSMGRGPKPVGLAVTAVLTPDRTYTRHRINLASTAGAHAVSVHGARALIAQLQEAIRLVVESCPMMEAPDFVDLSGEIASG